LHPAGLGVDGHDVLVVAFNRVIAKQLRDDIRARLKTFDRKHEPVIRTIHALCVEVIGEELRMLLPHEVDAMIYDVLHEYPEVAALYDGFEEAGQALRDHMPATPSICFCGWPHSNGLCGTRRISWATFHASFWSV
jgi:hypothetical protein